LVSFHWSLFIGLSSYEERRKPYEIHLIGGDVQIEIYFNADCAQGHNEMPFVGREPYEIHLIGREACGKMRMRRDP